MEGFGGWPVMGSHPGGNWDASQFNLEDLLIYARKGTNSLPLIDIGVSQDDKQPTKYILYVSSIRPSLTSQLLYLST